MRAKILANGALSTNSLPAQYKLSKTLLGLLLLCLIEAACGKHGQVKGRVSNFKDGSPIKGIEIAIETYRKTVMPTWGGSDLYWKSNTVLSDANGKFVIDEDYKNRNKYSYKINLFDGDAFKQGVLDTTSDFCKKYFYSGSHYSGLNDNQNHRAVQKTKETQEFDFSIVPLSRLKIVIGDVPVNMPGNIYVSFYDEGMQPVFGSFWHTFFSGSINQAGIQDPPPTYNLIPSNNKLLVRCQLIGSNGSRSFTETISLSPFCKKIYYVNFK